MRVLLMTIGLFFHLCAQSATTLDYELRPMKQIGIMVAEKLAARDFAFLEQTVTKLRTSKKLLSDGQPELSAFYYGIANCIQKRCSKDNIPPEAWERRRLLLNEWQQAYPNSSAVMIARAYLMKAFALHARGEGYINTVSAEQYKLFTERTGAARSIFEEIRSSSADDPAWYSGLLDIAWLQQWPQEKFDALYNEGVRRFPYYLPLYFTKAWYLTPRWGGTQAAFAKHVDEIARNTSATMGETMYSRLHWLTWGPEMFKSGQTDWRRMRQGFTKMTNDFPDQWNINNFAKFACVAGDPETLQTQLTRITTPIADAWGNLQYYENCVDYATRSKNCCKTIGK